MVEENVMHRLKVREVAKAKGFSMGKLQREANLSYQTVKLLYRDPYRDVSISTLMKIAEALNVSIAELVEAVKEPPQEN
jgi:DNA-binding Xre family transcriptional regulator